MVEEGLTLVKHYRQTAFMGFWEVLQNLGTIRHLLRGCKKDLLSHRPDVLILVDYPGFNLRMAKFAHQHGIRVFYFISPKVWAWNQKRAKKIKKYVDRMFSILPFEEAFYQKYDYNIDYVGNPLYDAYREFAPSESFEEAYPLLKEKPLIALLPGSRQMELQTSLPRLTPLSKRFPEYQFVVAGVESLPEYLYAPAKEAGIPVVYEQTYELLHRAEAAVVTSGTATLETALFDVPQVVVYYANPITVWLARQFIKVRFISLVNLILDKEAVTELIQKDFTLENVEQELQKLLKGGQKRQPVREDYARLREILHTEGTAERTAALMYEDLKSVH